RRALAAIGVLAALAAVPVAASATTNRSAAPADVPPPPPGFTLQWADDFDGAQGSPVDPSGWLYDTGTGYGCAGCPSQWGTFEIETMTSSTNNVALDAHDDLPIPP